MCGGKNVITATALIGGIKSQSKCSNQPKGPERFTHTETFEIAIS